MASVIENSNEAMTRIDDDIDLPSLACRAAIELDEVRQGRDVQLAAVQRLASRIAASVATSGSVPIANPSAIVIMSRAITDSNWSAQPPTNLQDLITQAKQVTDQLLEVAGPSGSNASSSSADIGKVHLFCLTLSRLSLAAERTRASARPGHPFRR